jgi:hypothetical protein
MANILFNSSRDSSKTANTLCFSSWDSLGHDQHSLHTNLRKQSGKTPILQNSWGTSLGNGQNSLILSRRPTGKRPTLSTLVKRQFWKGQRLKLSGTVKKDSQGNSRHSLLLLKIQSANRSKWREDLNIVSYRKIAQFVTKSTCLSRSKKFYNYIFVIYVEVNRNE